MRGQAKTSVNTQPLPFLTIRGFSGIHFMNRIRNDYYILWVQMRYLDVE